MPKVAIVLGIKQAFYYEDLIMGGGGGTTATYEAPVATAIARSITRNEGSAETSGISRRRRASGLNDTFLRAFSDSASSGGGKTTLGG